MSASFKCPCCGATIEINVYGGGGLGGRSGGTAVFGHPDAAPTALRCVLPENHPGPCQTPDGGAGYLGDGHSKDYT